MSDATRPAFIVFDIETIPDGVLLARVRYPGENLSPEEAVARAQEEERQRSSGSDFLPVAYQIPVAVCMAPVGADFRLRGLHSLDAPAYRTAEMVAAFWRTVNRHEQARLVTFNGRLFDLPVLELAAFRYGLNAIASFAGEARKRFGERHIDLMELLTNYGAIRLSGGLDLLSKILGKPGKTHIKGSDVYQLYRQGRLQEINDYCCYDVLDTYFVFLRTRVLVGLLTLEAEQAIVRETKQWLEAQCQTRPGLRAYLDNWGDWSPWP
jgi:predicted PolB exonuclease-like 3'-5' exonuclease